LSSTTTITASKDTYLNERRNTQNEGSATTISIGAAYQFGTWYKYSAVISFDVSGITDPSTITKAILTLEYVSSTGSTTQTVTVARLNQDFVEAEATWDDSASSVAWTGGGGAFGNAETTQPTYTFSVGSGVSANVTIDIKDLVIDAITRRSGTLLLVAAIAGTPTGSAQGFTKFATKENVTKSLSVIVTQAARIVWSGNTDGNMSTSTNWVGGVVPDANDYAMFIENGTNNPSSGAVVCERVYFGKLFSQDAGVLGEFLLLGATSVYADTQAQLHIYAAATEVIIRNTKDIGDGCSVRGIITNLYISDCVAEVTIDDSATISNIYIMSGSRINPISNTSTGVVSQVVIESGFTDANVMCQGRFNVIDNGECDDISLYGGGRYELNNTAEVDGIENLTIASDSICYFNAKEIQTALTMYGGTFTIEDNTNSQLDMPTTMTASNGIVNLDNGLDAVNTAAFTGTTFTAYGATLSLSSNERWDISQ
jgi:hypothetical protein